MVWIRDALQFKLSMVSLRSPVPCKARRGWYIDISIGRAPFFLKCVLMTVLLGAWQEQERALRHTGECAT